MDSIGHRLKELRGKKGLSQNDIAQLLGISRPAYVSYESGTTKPVRRLAQLAAILGTTSDYILTGNKKEEVPTASHSKDSYELIKLLLDDNSITQAAKDKLFLSIMVDNFTPEIISIVRQALRDYIKKHDIQP